MKKGYVEIKEWFVEKIEEVSKRYNTWIDVYSRDDNGIIRAQDGYLKVCVEEVLKETEKAVQVVLSTGDIVGSYKGWKTWIPKSVIR